MNKSQLAHLAAALFLMWNNGGRQGPWLDAAGGGEACCVLAGAAVAEWIAQQCVARGAAPPF